MNTGRISMQQDARRPNAGRPRIGSALVLLAVTAMPAWAQSIGTGTGRGPSGEWIYAIEWQAPVPATTSVQLVWDAKSVWIYSDYIAADSYELRYSTAPGLAFDDMTPVSDPLPAPGQGGGLPGQPNDTLSVTITGLAIFESYTFIMRTWWHGGAADSLPLDVTTLDDPLPPQTIDDLTGESTRPGQVTLHWTAVSDDAPGEWVQGYDIRWSPDGPILTELEFAGADPVPFPPAPLAPGQPQSFSVEGYPEGLIFHFAIRAIDEAGQLSPLSANSPPVTVATTIAGSDGNRSTCGNTAGVGSAVGPALLLALLAFRSR